MHKEIRLRMKQLLCDHKLATKGANGIIVKNIAQLALDLEVAEPTLRHYLDDRWTSLDRGLLERFADHLKCDADKIFETENSPFWKAFEGETSSLYYIRSWAKEPTSPRIDPVFRDDIALRLVNELVTKCARHTTVYGHQQGDVQRRFRKYANENVVVVGSPKSNLASEDALQSIFGITPDSPKKPPFRFVWHPDMQVQASVFGTDASGSPPRVGIWCEEKGMVEAGYNPDEEAFIEGDAERRDCAVVVVRNHKSGPDKPLRKMIVLAGFTRMGTEAAAERLKNDFRELEPRNGEEIVWGIVEAIVTKRPHTREQKVLHSDWRYRVGGRNPMNFKAKKISRRGSQQGEPEP
jgi:hypothetical protein